MPPTPRAVELTKALQALIGMRMPGDRLPGVRSLCTQFQTSSATLTPVLERLEREGKLIRRHGAGIFVTSPPSARTIVLLCGGELADGLGASPFWHEVISLTRKLVRDENLHFELHFARPDPETRAEHLSHPLQAEIEGESVAGILAIGLTSELAFRLSARKIPLVAISGPGPYYTRHGWEELIDIGLRELTRSGCSRLEIWTARSHLVPADIRAVRDRTLKRLQFPSERCPIRIGEAGVPLPEQGKRLWREGAPTDGLLILTDMLALGALIAAAEQGIEPGRDRVIATHANRGSLILAPWERRLIRLEFDAEITVRTAFGALRRLIAGEEPCALPPRDGPRHNRPMMLLQLPRLHRPDTEK
jgi:DNA-binding LacI/PurR family transcriptional regulator